MAKNFNLGSAFVRIFVRRDALKRDLEGAKADVNQATEQMGTGGLTRLGDGIKAATRPMRSFLSSIMGALGIFTRMLGIVSLIGAAIAGMVSAWKYVAEFAERSAKASQDQIDKQRELASDIRKSGAEDREATLEKINELYNINELREQELALSREIRRLEAGLAKPDSLNPLGTGFAESQIKELRAKLDKVEADLRAREGLLKKLERETNRDLLLKMLELQREQIRAIEGVANQLGQFNIAVSLTRLEQMVRLIVNRPL